MAALTARLRDFWFPAVPVRRVALFRVALVAFALVDAVVVAGDVVRYTQVDLAYSNPVYILKVLDLVVGGWLPTAGWFTMLHVAMLAALTAAMVGYRTRPSLLVGGGLYAYHYMVLNSFNKIYHGKISIVVALAVLLIAPAGAAYSVDAWRRRRRGKPEDPDRPDPLAGWALRGVTVLIALAYTVSAVSKLRGSGLSWVTDPVLATTMLERGGALHLFLMEQTWLLVPLQAVTLAIEVFALVMLRGGRLRDALLALFAIFHLGSYVLLGTEFLGWIVTYAAFYRLEVGFDRLRQTLLRSSPDAVAVAAPAGGSHRGTAR